MLERGVNVDTTMFDLKFQPPQNFASYRQSEIDNARVPTYTQMSAIPYVSNRFAMKRFLGMTDEEIAENERLWREENDESLSALPGSSDAELRDAGISGAGISSDLDNIEDEASADAPVEDGGADSGPQSATDAELGSSPNAEQTI